MAAEPIQECRAEPRLRLAPPEFRYAARVASWVCNDVELFEFAPRERAPLTVEKVLSWQVPGRSPRLLCRLERNDPIGYGEINLLSAARREYWLGHIILDPAYRGSGLGAAFVRLLLRAAFDELPAERVSLVVFPANRAAVSCYRRVGMSDIGYENHYFAARNRHCRLLRMAIERDEHDSRAAAVPR